MAKITEEQRELFNRRIVPYKALIKKIIDREKSILDVIAKDDSGASYKRLMLAEDMIYLSTVYMIINALSVQLLETKNEESLNDGRKALYKAVIYLEETVSNVIDAPYADYEYKVSQISSFSLEKRYFLSRKLGLAIKLIVDAYGANSKWRWAFVELQGRFACAAKNMLDLPATVKASFDGRSPDHDTAVYYLRMVKKQLSLAADGYRDRYELSTKRLDDMRLGINYLLAYRRILLVCEERDEAEEAKKKAVVWKSKMEVDQKKGGGAT